jgi:ABC-type transport system involved in multi-copper enzyme maturation permease subunit
MSTVRAEDVMSVGTRVSWGAIFAGCVLSLALFFMLGILGGAVGVSISDRVEPTNLRTGALIWAIVTLCASLFVGGVVTSQFTVGENKAEAILYGILMWALLFGILLGLAAAGVRAGMSGMVGMANLAATASSESWEAGARKAGVSADQIEEWRRTLQPRDKTPQTPPSSTQVSEATTRITWYAFAGTWISLFAAAAGAWLGAGPTFRLFAMGEPTRGPVVG